MISGLLRFRCKPYLLRMKILKPALLISLLIVPGIQAVAQLKTWITLESGPQWSLIKVSDPDAYFRGSNVLSYMAGVTLGQEIIPNLAVHTGILYVPRRDGIRMIDERPNQSGWQVSNSILIPLRAEYTIQPTEYPVCFTPRIGYVYRLDSPPDELYAASSILSAPDGTALFYDIQQADDPGISHLLEVGMGINLRFPNHWQASVNLSYMTGLQGSPATHYSLDYYNGSGVSSSTEYNSKGNSVFTTLALNIPVSNIWQNRDYRIRARIENSVYKGKPVDRRGQVYLGGELGALWRMFDSSNPAVGPIPLEDRGFFRYSNLHAGIYAGYMLTADLGIDVGINYQRSSTFYALMYDHEVDFTTREPAPLYLEFPVRLRYFYNVYKQKIYLVFTGGASLLTHFSKGVYDQASAGFTYNSPAIPAPVSATTTYEASGVKNLAPLIRLGTGVEYRLPTRFPLIATLYVNYLQGYMDLEQIRVSNTLPESPVPSTITYRGSGWSADLGIKIPFRLGGAICGQLPERVPE